MVYRPNNLAQRPGWKVEKTKLCGDMADRPFGPAWQHGGFGVTARK